MILDVDRNPEILLHLGLQLRKILIGKPQIAGLIAQGLCLFL